MDGIRHRLRHALARRRAGLGWDPTSDGCCVALEVEDFDAAIAQLKAVGVRFKREPFPTPVCQMAFIFDPDSNVVCIHKRHAGHH